MAMRRRLCVFAAGELRSNFIGPFRPVRRSDASGGNISRSGGTVLRLDARVELVAGNEVHPYHLLRYDRAIFSQAALEKLQKSLKASAPKRQAEVA